jgi:PKD repeat protein
MRFKLLFALLLGSFALAARAACPTAAPGAATRALVIASGCGGNTACPNGTVNFTLKPQPSGGIPPAFTDPGYIVEACDTVTWDFGDGGAPVVVIGANTVAYDFPTPGNYTVTATAKNTLGTTTFSSRFAIASNPSRIGFLRAPGTITPIFATQENETAVTITVVRSLDTTRAVSATIESIGGDATEAVAAIGKSMTTVTFEPGQTQKTFTLPILNDHYYEFDRYYELAFRSGTGGVIFNVSGYVQIIDDEPQPVLSTVNVRAPEGSAGNPINIPITLTGPIGFNYTVFPFIQAGTATADDFDTTPHGVVIPAGQTTATLPIVVFGNNQIGPDKQFRVTLTPAGVDYEPRFLNSSSTVTIANDDATLTPDSARLTSGESVTLHLDIGPPFDAPKTIAFTSSAPAIVPPPAAIVLPAGTSTADVVVTTTGATASGMARITAQIPEHIAAPVTVTTESALVVTPRILNILAGQETTLTLKMQPALPEGQTVAVEANNASIASVTPPVVTIAPGGSATVKVRGLRSGATYLFASIPGGAPLTIELRVGDGSPTVTAIVPNSGPAVGGTRVTLRGENLSPACGVTFGDAVAGGLTASNGDLIVTTPPHAPGAVDVTVRCGTAGTTAAKGFAYFHPKPRAAR